MSRYSHNFYAITFDVFYEKFNRVSLRNICFEKKLLKLITKNRKMVKCETDRLTLNSRERFLSISMQVHTTKIIDE